MVKTGQTVWVCVDCMLSAEGYELDETPAREPWNLVYADLEVTPGMVKDEHDEDCPNRPVWVGAERYCETRDFSWSACDACGSPLGGSRHAYTLWS